MNNVVLYIENKINSFTKYRYNEIKKQSPYEVYWCTVNNVDIDGKVFKCANFSVNILAAEQFYKEHSEYDRYYILSNGFYYSGDFNNLINNLDSHPEVDLYASYLDTEDHCSLWSHFNTYHKEPGENITLLKGCIYFAGISNKAMLSIVKCSDKLRACIDELWVPTVVYNAGCVLESLDSISNESNPDFCKYHLKYTDPQTLFYNTSFNDRTVLDKKPGKIFAGYNNENNIIDIEGWRNIKNENTKLSIVIPVYNAEKYLEECIESCLNQTYQEFEIIIVNDGSTDNTVDIISKYKDNDKVLYFKKDHNGIAETLNLGINNANGKYIVRMDADDIMLPNRLEHQIYYMETHPDIDILSSSFVWGNDKLGTPKQESCTLPERYIIPKYFMHGNCMAHPAVIMKKESLMKLPYIYEQYYEGVEDMKLWILAMKHGLVVASEPTDVIIYRQHSDQVTISAPKDDKRIPTEKLLPRVRRLINPKKPSKDLTVVIPFRNEGSEIERTVQNIRATSEGLHIILINDGSNDNYDYKWIADNFDCVYVENKESIGVAASRDLGVQLSTTNYFVLLDGHMRMYDDNWDELVVNTLKEHPKALLTSMSTEIYRVNDTGTYTNEYGDRKINYTYGAYINLDEEGHEFTGKWTSQLYPKNKPTDDLITLSCVMGAFYCSSKEWWNYIGGLKGLHNWGQDEPLISLKTWMMGGEVLCLRNLFAGHIYRKKTPWRMEANKIYSNSIYINHLFARNDNEAKLFDERLKKRIGEGCFRNSMGIFQNHIGEFNEFKKYFETHTVQSLDWFIANINDPVIAAKNKK